MQQQGEWAAGFALHSHRSSNDPPPRPLPPVQDGKGGDIQIKDDGAADAVFANGSSYYKARLWPN